MGIMDKKLRVTMPDGSKWDVPVSVIARDRAKWYRMGFDGDIERSLAEDTIPLFEKSDYEIMDWAAGSMNWSDVENHALCASAPPDLDHQESWVNGDKEIVD